MSKQITGSASVLVDGKEYATSDEITFNPGGTEREAKTGNKKVHGFVETTVAPSLSMRVFHNADLSLKELNAITGATVLVTTDTGRKYTMRDAFTTNTQELNTSAGEVQVEMSAIKVDED